MATDDRIDQAKDVVESVADNVDAAAQTAARKAKAAADTVSLKAREAQFAAEDALDDGRDMIEETLTCAKEMVRAHPLTTVLGVAAVAYLLGRLRV